MGWKIQGIQGNSAIRPLSAAPDTEEDLRLLIAPDSSLGGARPKASIRENDGSLAIAKFPRKDDEWSTVRWEAVALSLAHKAGISVPRKARRTGGGQTRAAVAAL